MTEPSNEGRVDVAVIGTGNIGTDLMIKILRTSKDLNLAAVAGIDPNSDGLRRADHLGVPTTFNGVDGLIGMEAFSDVQIVVDATSARAHAYHAEVLARSGRRLVDGSMV